MKHRLPAALLDELADRFKALAEPSRLSILSVLHAGEQSVGELVRQTGLGQANVSKHLDVLRRYAFVERRRDGLNVYYRMADKDVFRICDIMCGRAGRGGTETFTRAQGPLRGEVHVRSR